MQRGLVGSEMCIRDRYQRRVHGNEKNFSSVLGKLRQIVVDTLPFPDSPKGIEMTEQLKKFGITDIESAWKSIKGVFASKFNERAYIATRKLGITLEKIYMAVLVQKVINAEYSFVIHSKNPMSNDEDELYGEIAVGLGEALVGSYAGQSLSFSFNKKNGTTKVLTLPNKTFCLKSQGGYMFRSDSNTEDLEGFAGAGLFDSIPSASFVRHRVSYSNEKLINDKEFRDYFIKLLCVIGEKIEKIYDGKPQDIEGCYSEEKFYVVQTRPQVQRFFFNLNNVIPVSYTHLTLPTILLVQISVVAVSLKKKKISIEFL
eukprot:TRINITY_DN3196_c0_g1_i3.p1 TRINITY_DN3196_c0_g1~~TRINITY_DN3196_c0_g1_i3.p1  ORF type:complete len:315 (-),score=78.26 TRINITY_DN3196_c0_g1_i3:86-1030(-)